MKTTYENPNQFEGWKPCSVGDYNILCGKKGSKCELAIGKQNIWEPAMDKVMMIDSDDDHAVLMFEDINVDFVKEKI
jgi:hypothetical protein